MTTYGPRSLRIPRRLSGSAPSRTGSPANPAPHSPRTSHVNDAAATALPAPAGTSTSPRRRPPRPRARRRSTAADAADYGSAGAAFGTQGRAGAGRHHWTHHREGALGVGARVQPEDARRERQGAHGKPPTSRPTNWAKKVAADFLACRVKGDDLGAVLREFHQSRRSWRRPGKGSAAVPARSEIPGRPRPSGPGDRAQGLIRWLEDRGWIGTLNTLYRDEKDRSLRRGNNVVTSCLDKGRPPNEIAAVEEPEEQRQETGEHHTSPRGALVVEPRGPAVGPERHAGGVQ